jgi:hypothetical protein
MALAPCADVSPASWLTASGTDPWQLITCGPAGFAGYARLRFISDPRVPGQSENDVDVDENSESEAALVRGALDVLARHTATPGDCFFCLWDGWGSAVHGGDGLRIADIGPTVPIPYRDCFLFRGPLADFGDWGADRRLQRGHRRARPNSRTRHHPRRPDRATTRIPMSRVKNLAGRCAVSDR